MLDLMHFVKAQTSHAGGTWMHISPLGHTGQAGVWPVGHCTHRLKTVRMTFSTSGGSVSCCEGCESSEVQELTSLRYRRHGDGDGI